MTETNLDNKHAPPRKTLYVKVDLGNGDIVLAGKLSVNRQEGVGTFQYASSYCRNERAFPLDPINLPLEPSARYETPVTRYNLGIPGALKDAGPDNWGKKVLQNLSYPPPTSDIDFLLAGSGNGTGAVYFTEARGIEAERAQPEETALFLDRVGENGETENVEAVSPENIEMVAPPRERDFESVDQIIETAFYIDQGIPVSQKRSLFFEHGSSLGGERPKAFVDQRNSDGYLDRWIVKFPRRGDLVDNAKMEHASAEMARDAGVDAVETKAVDTDMGTLLLVKRFDIHDNGNQDHILTARSLANARDYDVGGQEESYPNFGRIARQICEDGVGDNKEMYRRMLFNIAIGNVDDHANNQSFRKPPEQTDYLLSPAYDVLPTVGMEGSPQAISVGPMGGHQNTDNLTAATKEMGIDPADAAQIATDVLDATENWQERFTEAGLNQQEIGAIGKSMVGRQSIESFLNTIPQNERERARTAGRVTGPSIDM